MNLCNNDQCDGHCKIFWGQMTREENRNTTETVHDRLHMKVKQLYYKNKFLTAINFRSNTMLYKETTFVIVTMLISFYLRIKFFLVVIKQNDFIAQADISRQQSNRCF